MGITIKLENYVSNFKKCSATVAGNSLVEDENIILYNFDEIKEEIARQLGVRAICKSCDGLLMNEQENILFEFKRQEYTILKNQEEGKVNIYSNNEQLRRNDLKIKAFDSKAILNLLRNNNIITSNKDILYIIYKSGQDKQMNKTLEKNEVEEISPEITKRFQMIGRKKQSEFIAFGLEKMKGKIYDEIYTCNKQEFIEKFLNKNIK